MKNQEHGESVLFRYIRQDIALLYDLLFDYVSRHSKDKPPYQVPDTFTLVCAFGYVFPEMSIVSGHTGFVSTIDRVRNMVTYDLPHHYWLIWRDENHIIDLVPIDGKFGISTPQAIIQSSERKRFFAFKKMPSYLKSIQKTPHNNSIRGLIDILEELMEKVPL